MTKPKFPIEIKRGSARVKIYFTPSKGCDSHTLSYWFNGQRKRQTFSDLAKAKQEAEKIASRLTRGDLDVLTLSSDDRASYLRAKNLLDVLDVPLEMAAADYAQARRALGATPLSEAVDFYLLVSIAGRPVPHSDYPLSQPAQADFRLGATFSQSGGASPQLGGA